MSDNRSSENRLAADAQYRLGETLYVQRRYKPAGQAFLAVIERHKQSAKVPNSLLKLAQSLDQLGQLPVGDHTTARDALHDAPDPRERPVSLRLARFLPRLLPGLRDHVARAYREFVRVALGGVGDA